MTSFPHRFDICPGALLVVVGDSMDVELTQHIARCVAEIDRQHRPDIVELVPSYASILVIYDQTISSASELEQVFAEAWGMTQQTHIEPADGNVMIDVVYGDSSGDDLANVAENAGLSIEDVITLHASATYTVGAVGFAPGFTYLIGLPPVLATPRRSTPRLRVPAGSVGIGGAQTGIYALPSSGGWNLIGRTATTLFDPAADPPVRLKLGDTVSFRRVADADLMHLERATAIAPAGDGPIEVVTPGMQTTVQDLGRYGYGRFGFATDGAADRASLAAANMAVGSPVGAAALEITHAGPTLRFYRRLAFALAGADLGARLNGRAVVPGRRYETMPGDELAFQPQAGHIGARTYLAVRGGFDVPLVLGSASTNLTAGIGGWQGRALVRGDRLSVGQQEIAPMIFTPGMQPRTDPADRSPLRVAAGPQRNRFDDATWQRLLSEAFTVSDDANRVGLRLLGPSLAPRDGADLLSEGIVTGSIQVTGEGQAIVMLPGHATIGGYTKIATVIPEDWDRLGQLSPGDEVRFIEVMPTAERVLR